MTAWEYGELIDTLQGEDDRYSRTVTWIGPDGQPAEMTGHPVKALSFLGGNGWELVSARSREGTVPGHSWSTSTYTMKRPLA